MHSKLLPLLKVREWISSRKLAKKIGVSRQALHKQIHSLRKIGYKIEAKPKLGYCLMSKPDLLLPEEIYSGLKTKIIGKKIFHYETIHSTQNLAKELAEKGETEGTLILAEEQSAGRGRLGRKWDSPQGGIWCSLILRPKISPQSLPPLSLVISLAVEKAIEDFCKIPSTLKWPNDILIQDSKFKVQNSKWKKVCGILIEMSAEMERVKWVVLGIGLNVNNSIPKYLENQAVSLKDAIGNVDRIKLLQSLLTYIEGYYERFLSCGFAALRKDYLKKSILVGKEILVMRGEEKISGKFREIDEFGSLVLETPTRQLIQLATGEVTLKN